MINHSSSAATARLFTASLLAAATASLLIAGTASAGTITLSDRATIAAALGVAAVVEDFTADAHFPISTGELSSSTSIVVASGTPITPGMIKPGVTYSTPIGSDNFFNIDTSGVFDGGFLDNANGAPTPLTVTFDAPRASFGFDTNKLGGTAFSITIFHLDSGPYSSVVNIPYTFSLTGFGFTSDATDILSVMIQMNSAAFGFAIDNFTFAASSSGASAVAEPGSLSLLGASLLGLGLTRQRRRGA